MIKVQIIRTLRLINGAPGAPGTGRRHPYLGGTNQRSPFRRFQGSVNVIVPFTKGVTCRMIFASSYALSLHGLDTRNTTGLNLVYSITRARPSRLYVPRSPDTPYFHRNPFYDFLDSRCISLTNASSGHRSLRFSIRSSVFFVINLNHFESS